MKTKLSIILLFAVFATFVCQAQTKVIAHKSHSGSSRTFKTAYQKNLFDINRSNFGLPGNKTFVALDTVVALNDSVTILKMRVSNVCFPYNKKFKELKASDFKSVSDTLINHDVYNRKFTETFIRSSGATPMTIDNNLKDVVFVGFKK